MKLLIALCYILLSWVELVMAEEFTKNPDLFDYLAAENRDLGFHSDDHKWTGTNKLLEALYLGLWLADYNQTRQIARQPEKYNEDNVFLGENPSRRRVNTYFAATALLHPAFMHIWPSKVRNYLEGLSIAYQQKAVRKNSDLGLDVVRWR